MSLDIFESTLSNEGATGMVDPVSEESFNPLDNFDKYQTETNAEARDYSNEKVDLSYGLAGEEPSDDILVDYLKSKGINPDAIKVQDEDDEEIKEVKYSDLSKEEKLELLKYNNAEEYTETELQAINFLRENDMSIQDLAKAIREETLASMSKQEEPFAVDDYSDDELFIADFKNKYGDDFTDDELNAALEKAKESDDVFAKQINKVREDYKEYEKEERAENDKESSLKQEEKENAYISDVVKVAKSLNDMHDTIELDDNDKEDILSYMFDKTVAGKSKFDKDILDPEVRYKAAWYVKHGDEAFRQIHSYYQKEISKLSKGTKSVKTEAFMKDRNQTDSNKRPKSLEDLYK